MDNNQKRKTEPYNIKDAKPELYCECMQCDKPMIGIMSHRARTICHKCDSQ